MTIEEILERLRMLRHDYYRRATDAHSHKQLGRGAALNCAGDDMDRLIEAIGVVDARLIEAAPDLLAACEAYVCSNTTAAADRCDLMIRAAIKEATGE